MIFLKLETPYLKKGHGDLDAENNSKDNLEKTVFWLEEPFLANFSWKVQKKSEVPFYEWIFFSWKRLIWYSKEAWVQKFTPKKLY